MYFNSETISSFHVGLSRDDRHCYCYEAVTDQVIIVLKRLVKLEELFFPLTTC